MSVLLSGPARAQVDTGTIRGTVKDQSGAVLPGATVTITHEGQALTLTTVTRQDGTYIFTSIRTGAYAVDVELRGLQERGATRHYRRKSSNRRWSTGQLDPVTGLAAARAGSVREAFPGNQIPMSRLDPSALRLMRLYPEPNLAGLNNNYVVNRTNTDDTHAFDVRVDHNFSGNDRMFARYSFSDNHKLRPPPFEGDADGGGFNEGDEMVRVNAFAASHTHMFSNTLVNEARFGLSREHTKRLQPYGDDTSNLPARYGILGVPQLPGNGGLPASQA